jgi:hypothetical protein
MIPATEKQKKKKQKEISKKSQTKALSKAPQQLTIREQITKNQSLGSKMIKSKDIIDTDISLFTTQRKRVLDFARESEIPSKFIFPVIESEIYSYHPSEIFENLETILDFIQRNNNLDVNTLIDKIKNVQPKISESEALYFISDVLPNDEDFEKSLRTLNFSYNSLEEFLNEKTKWKKEVLPRLLARDEQDIIKINNYFEKIVEEAPVRTSEMTISKMTIEYDIELPENEDLLQIAPDIFANLKTSYEIPFIQYNDFQNRKYKVFKGETFESRPPFKLFKDRFTKFEDSNRFYMILLADPSPNISEYNKSSYIPAMINLEKNILSFKYFVLTSRPEKELIQAIQNVFPTLILKNRREKNYGAYFNIYDTVVREDSFLDLLVTEPFLTNDPSVIRPFSSVLFADEFEKPVSEKKKLKLYYDTTIGFEEEEAIEIEGRERQEELSKKASLGFYMTQYLSGVNDSGISKGRYTITEFEDETENNEKIIGIPETKVKSLLLQLNTPYIVVSISKAVNRFVLFQFMNIFSRLLNLYNQLKPEIQEEYNYFIPELQDEESQELLSLIIKPKKKIGEERFGKINLSTIAPEIFTESYSKRCQYTHQPIIIPEGEVDNWKEKKIKTDEGKNIERPVKNLGDYYFVCPTDQLPFVEFKQNLDDGRQFEYYPCCYTSEKRGGIKEKATENIYRSKEPIKTNKIMTQGNIAVIPTPIEVMIKGAFSENINFYRMGTFISPNSFLACVCLALNDKNFIKIKDPEEKESYLATLRMEISNRANFLVASSELFDVSEKDRIANFKKVEEYLDPTIYYRVLEEVFGLNIFVFSGSIPKPNVNPVYSLEVSRFSSIPTHSFKRDLPTMMIYKHWGSENNHLDFPQCELIVSRKEDDDEDLSLLYSDSLAKYLLKAYFISAEVYGRLYIPEMKIFENYNSQFLYQILQMDFLGTFMNPKSPIRAIGQIIDEKGKLSALQIVTPRGKMSIGVPPLPPQNLPMITTIENPRLVDVLDIFRDPPTGFSYDGDNIVAVWFQLLSLDFGIQIPVKPISKSRVDTILPEVPENRFVLQPKISEIQRLFKLQKDVNIIVQLIRWIYLVSIEKDVELNKEEYSEEKKMRIKLSYAKEFLENIVLMTERTNGDSASVYDFSKLPRKLPNERDNFDSILSEINKTAPTFTDGKNIFISGQTFYERIQESLFHYIRLNLPIFIPDYLDGYYESTYDYPIIPKTLVFLSDIDFKRWLTQAIEDPTSTYPVLYSLKSKLSDIEYPFLYSFEKQKATLVNPFGEMILFIIQNVPYNNAKVNALENAQKWKDVQINHPTESDKDISEFKNYKVFTISSNESFELLEDKSDPDQLNKTLFILNYPNTNKYASILPI